MQKRGLHDQLRARVIVEDRGDRRDATTERIAGRVAADLAIRLEGQRGRHPEELEIVERFEVGAVDHRGALGLEADGDARAGEPGTVVADERDVGRAADPDEPRGRALLADPGADRLEHLAVRKAVDRRAEGVAEGRPDSHDDLVRCVA